MANYCYYEMKITGRNEENVNKVANYVSEKLTIKGTASLNDMEEINGLYTRNIYGDCKWSIYSSMMKRTKKELFKTVGLEDFVETRDLDLDELSRDNKVIIEVYSQESGCQFQEHYVFEFGEQRITDDCVDWSEYYVEDYEGDTNEERIEELNKENNTDFTVDDIDMDGYVHLGGYDNFGEFRSYTKEKFEELCK